MNYAGKKKRFKESILQTGPSGLSRQARREFGAADDVRLPNPMKTFRFQGKDSHKNE
jgi:hypothetical protein